MARLHQLLRPLHQVLASIAPTQARVDVCGLESDMEHIVRLDGMVEQQGAPRVKESPQLGVELRPGEETFVQILAGLGGEGVGICMVIQDAPDEYCQVEHEHNDFVLAVPALLELDEGVAKGWGQVTDLPCPAPQTGEALVVFGEHIEPEGIEAAIDGMVLDLVGSVSLGYVAVSGLRPC